MATKSRKAATKSNSVATLTTTRLKKLAVEVVIPRGESRNGKLNLSYQISLLLPKNNEPLIVVSLQIKGVGLSEDKELSDKTAFTFEAVFEGLFTLSSKSDANDWAGREIYLANYLVPTLADMIETLLSKCEYSGISIPRSFLSQPAAIVL
jgi:predicted nucleic acid-binding protein